jgi:purine-binding chemotaxis protein CheW
MATKKTNHDKQLPNAEAPAASKAVVSTKSKLDLALDFANVQLSLDEPAGEQPVAATASTVVQKDADKRGVNVISPKISAWSLMPRSDKARQVLQARAKIFSKQEVEEKRGNEQYIRFRLGKSALYGVSYINTEEILFVTKISRVPCTPLFIAGIVNYRGEMLTVLNLKEIFRVECDKSQREKSWIIVVRDDKLIAGLWVDEIDDNDEFTSAHLLPPLDDNGLVRGIHLGKVAILNINSILNHPTLNVDEAVI